MSRKVFTRLAVVLFGGFAVFSAVLLAATSEPRAAAPAADVRAEKAKLQGTWKLIAWEVDGENWLDEDVRECGLRLVVGRDRLTLGDRLGHRLKDEEVLYTLDPSTSPKAIVIGEGKSASAGTYELRKAVLTLRLAASRPDRGPGASLEDRLTAALGPMILVFQREVGACQKGQ